MRGPPMPRVQVLVRWWTPVDPWWVSQSLQVCEHGEATGCSLTVKPSAQENRTRGQIFLGIVL